MNSPTSSNRAQPGRWTKNDEAPCRQSVFSVNLGAPHEETAAEGGWRRSYSNGTSSQMATGGHARRQSCASICLAERSCGGCVAATTLTRNRQWTFGIAGFSGNDRAAGCSPVPRPGRQWRRMWGRRRHLQRRVLTTRPSTMRCWPTRPQSALQSPPGTVTGLERTTPFSRSSTQSLPPREHTTRLTTRTLSPAQSRRLVNTLGWRRSCSRRGGPSITPTKARSTVRPGRAFFRPTSEPDASICPPTRRQPQQGSKPPVAPIPSLSTTCHTTTPASTRATPPNSARQATRP